MNYPESPGSKELSHLVLNFSSGRFREAEEAAAGIVQRYPEHPIAWKVLGLALLERGFTEDAQTVLAKALTLAPDDAELHRVLGDALMDLSRLDEAEQSYRSAININPADTAALNNHSLSLMKLGRPEEAILACQSAIHLNPSFAEAFNNLGNALAATGRFVEAEESFKQAIALHPVYTDAQLSLGRTQIHLRNFEAAEKNIRAVLCIKHDFYEAHVALGSALSGGGDIEGAVAAFQSAIGLTPKIPQLHNELGLLLAKLQLLHEAEQSYRVAIKLKPEFVAAHCNLALMLVLDDRCDEAEAVARLATEIDPNSFAAHTNRGLALRRLGRLDEAEVCYREALLLQPESGTAYNNLGNLLNDFPKGDDAQSFFKKAVAIQPGHRLARSNLLFSLNYDHRVDLTELYRHYENFGQWVQAVTTHQFDHVARLATGGRRIRIGYSSPDFRGHACRFFMEPLFRNHDREQFELFAYSNTISKDGHTERLKEYFDHWIDVVRLSDGEMAERIYADQIDILVDMAGHTNGNRLLVFAMRPAPVQVSSNIGYGYTSGLTEIDYFLGDENLTPLGSEKFFSEQIYRLPAPGYAYEPPRAETPDVCELPALRKGYVTFGSCTRTVRLNDSLLRVWGEVLERIPTSRLRLDQKCFRSQGVRDLFWQRLEGLGVPRDRVELTCSEPHWLGFQEIDITLDTWPHNSGTTLLESLWMGVPVLSKTDRASVGCIGAAALRPLGLQDWVVEDEEAFIARAVAAASDLKALASLRSELRERLEQSPHMDAITVTQNIEAAYHQMISELPA